MTITSVVGLQWGDEAKGKIVDLLTDEHQVVVRYQGGNNAGHTVKFDGKTYKLSLLPTGVLRPGVTAIIGNGVVVNPEALQKEIDTLRAQGVDISTNLLLSDRAHVILPYHVAEDGASERSYKKDAIGTTGRGIGFCYRDKAGRSQAVRVGDLYHPASLEQRLDGIVKSKNHVLSALDPEFQPFASSDIFALTQKYATALKPYVTDTVAWLHRAIKEKRNILFEGAQGSLLDVDHGTYPYVTSSNSSSAGIHPGSGVPERLIDEMIGVVKAYTTRVGGGPFPTELDNEIGQHIRDVGHEYGTVTGRPRRCGWFDAVAAGHGAKICGVDCISLMLLDVLSQLDELKICEAYEIGGERTTDFPAHVEDLANAKPIYRTIPGWKTDICGVTRLADLPAGARKYIDTIGELMEKPVKIVSVGPDRAQTILG
ncbi:MAG: adenylosuccinate synthase [Planctomyces sp.]|nr:adenylosuccinate synthase [Planctomyces sp.]